MAISSKRFFFFSLFTLLALCGLAQFSIKGKVTDAANGEPLPFVIIQFKGTSIGAQTDFEGNYAINASYVRDSITATYVGYKSKIKPLKLGESSQIINFQLTENAKELGEVIIKRGENPAWSILRKIQKSKKMNDKRSLAAYEYESYSKVQVDIDNISQKIRKRKILKKVIAAIDSLKKVTNDEGKPIIPIYLSETISKINYQNDPIRQKEHILAHNISGVLDESNAQFISQITGSSITEFNFYQNWIQFMGKDFVSPIAESWAEYYDYDLEDSLFIDSAFCYKINVKPKRAADLAFKGTIWVTKNEYAIRRCDLTIGKTANINFVDKIKIQQEFQRTSEKAWLPYKMRFGINLAELVDSSAGFLIKYYISNNDIKVNEPKSEDFFQVGLETAENANDFDKAFWQKNRHDSLSNTDKQVIAMIDTLKNLPVIRSYIEILDIVVNGYKKVGLIEIGPYSQSIAWNNIEGIRFKLGLRSSYLFSKKWLLKSYIAYGTTDKRLKYGGSVDFNISKRKWFWAGIEYFYDLEQLGIFSFNKGNVSTLFYAISRWGNLSNANPFYINNFTTYAQIDVIRGVTAKLQFNYQNFNQVPMNSDRYNFGYYSVPGDTNSTINNTLNNAELVFETRIARRETFLYYEHNRISIGNEQIPMVTLRYHLGLKGLGGSHFAYHKLAVQVQQMFTVGKFGRSNYTIRGNYIPNTLPFPLLNIHLGNQTLVYSAGAFSLMNFFEFVSSRSVTLNYQHHFSGFFFNRIPLFYKLKLREVVSFNAIWGTATQSDLNLTPKNESIQYRNFYALDPNIPYMEAGIGIENIAKVFRVEFYKRLSYLAQDYEIQNWGIKVGVSLSL
ncbi:MAG: DUF5686 family protein [Cytophagales bacterium]